MLINESEITLGGDIILSVNGMTISRDIENLDFLNQKIYKIKLLRGGKIIDVEIRFKEE